MTVEFHAILPDAIDGAWDACIPHLEKSFSRRVTAYSVEDLKNYCEAGLCQLWVAFEDGQVLGVAITLLTVEPMAKTCTIMNMGGTDFRRWVGPLNARLTAFARDNGCQKIEAVTRRGFSRFDPEFVEDGVVYIKEVTP
jgi:hypothetical protein